MSRIAALFGKKIVKLRQLLTQQRCAKWRSMPRGCYALHGIFLRSLQKGQKHTDPLCWVEVFLNYFFFSISSHISAHCCGAVDIKGQNPQFVSLEPATIRSARAEECEVRGLVAKSLSACGFCLKALAPWHCREEEKSLFLNTLALGQYLSWYWQTKHWDSCQIFRVSSEGFFFFLS